jgi:hypothetical protein
MGLQMIIKVAHSEYGVFFVDDARLSCQYAVAPTDFTVSSRDGLKDVYNINLTIQANKNTNFTGVVYAGYGMEIVGSNVTFNQTAFRSVFSETSMVVNLRFGQGAIEIWMPIMLVLGLIGLILVVILPAFIVYEIRKKKYGWLVTGFFIWMIAMCLVIGWLWG